MAGNNDFTRSNLTIQPKQRLMSAGSFINPVRTYDANEQMRIVESFRGLSTQSDALIDSFIKKKQEEAQAKADMYMTDALLDTNHPEHKKAKEMMTGLKPQAANLLGVDFWTQQYIYKAQAEQELKNEEYEMLEAKQTLANLSPDEFREELGKIRAKTNERIASYPKGVSDYFYRMPRQQLTDKVRDEHYKGIMQEQLKARDTIFKNKIINAMDNADTGLLNIEINMLSEEEFKMRYAEFTEEKRKNIDQQAIKLGEILGDVPVVVGANNKIIKTEMFDNYANKIVAVKDSSLYQEMRGYVLEAADIGTNSQTIQANLLDAMKGAIDKGNDEEMVAAAYLVLMTELNTDKELTSALGSWRYENKPVDKNNKGIVNFDLALAETSAKELLNYGASAKARELERARINDYYEKKEQQEFLELLARNEVITKQDWLTLDGWQIAEKAGGLDYYKYADAINAYKEAVTKGFNIPYTDKHRKQFGDTLYAIQTGRIKDKGTITQMAATGRDFHINDYPALLKAFDEEGGSKADRRVKNTNQLLFYVYKDIDGIDDSIMGEREKDALKADLFRDVFDMNMEFSTDNMNKVIRYYQTVVTLSKQDKDGSVFAKPFAPSNKELQTNEQFTQSMTERQGVMATDEYGNKVPIQRVENTDTLEDFTQTDFGQALKSVNLTDEQVQQVYSALQANTKQSDKIRREKELTSKLKDRNLDERDLLFIYDENPELVKTIMGVEVEVVNDRVLPVDPKIRKKYTDLYEYYGDDVSPLIILNMAKDFKGGFVRQPAKD